MTSAASSPSPTDGMPPAPVALSLPAGTTAEQVAVLVTVLLAASAGGADAAPNGAGSWADHGRAVRHTVPHGAGAWRASALPR